MVKTTSPRAAWKPAISAAALPKLRRNRIAPTRGSRPGQLGRAPARSRRGCRRRRRGTRPARAPPSANTAASSACRAARLSSSLWTGMTTLMRIMTGSDRPRLPGEDFDAASAPAGRSNGTRTARGGQLGGHPDQPQHQRRDDRAIRAQRGGQGRHQHALAHAQAAGHDRHHEPGHGRQRHAGDHHGHQARTTRALGTARDRIARTTASWLRPSRTQPAVDQSSPCTSSRPESRGNASGPTPGIGRLTSPASRREHRRQDHDQERQAQPQARQRRQAIERQLDAVPRPGSVTATRPEPAGHRKPGRRDQSARRHHHQRLVERRDRRRRRPGTERHDHPRPHHHHHRLARHILAQVAHQVRPQRRDAAGPASRWHGGSARRTRRRPTAPPGTAGPNRPARPARTGA